MAVARTNSTPPGRVPSTTVRLRRESAAANSGPSTTSVWWVSSTITTRSPSGSWATAAASSVIPGLANNTCRPRACADSASARTRRVLPMPPLPGWITMRTSGSSTAPTSASSSAPRPISSRSCRTSRAASSRAAKCVSVVVNAGSDRFWVEGASWSSSRASRFASMRSSCWTVCSYRRVTATSTAAAGDVCARPT